MEPNVSTLCLWRIILHKVFFPSLVIPLKIAVRTSFGNQVKGVDIEVLLYIFYISLSTEKVILLSTWIQEFQIQLFWNRNIKCINYNTILMSNDQINSHSYPWPSDTCLSHSILISGNHLTINKSLFIP